MRCTFKLRNGRQCIYQLEKGEKLCDVHDPAVLPILFTEECDGFGKYPIMVTSLSVQKAQEYIDAGVAVRVDYELKKKLDDDLLKLLRVGVKKLRKEVKESDLCIKKMIALRDEESLESYFEGSQDFDPEKMRAFITRSIFTPEEQVYLKAFIKNRLIMPKN